MENFETTRKRGYHWIRSEEGNCYLCPVGVINKIDNLTEEDLKNLCVDESNNPQNN